MDQGLKQYEIIKVLQENIGDFGIILERRIFSWQEAQQP